MQVVQMPNHLAKDISIVICYLLEVPTGTNDLQYVHIWLNCKKKSNFLAFLAFHLPHI